MKSYFLFLLLFPFYLCGNFFCQFDNQGRLSSLRLGDLGSVDYIYDDGHLAQINRLSSDNALMYSHKYHYDTANNSVKETLIGDVGEIVYEIRDDFYITTSPYHYEMRHYNQDYFTDVQGQQYISQDFTNLQYDQKGNLSSKGDFYYRYDDNNRLIQASCDTYDARYFYDSQGVRVSKTIEYKDKKVTENYLNLGINDIAIFDENGSLKALRIPGLSFHPQVIRSIAIETPDKIYAPIHNFKGDILKLVDIGNKEVVNKNFPIPWVFAGKHYDKETGLVYFGARYYDPHTNRWITQDPLGTTQGEDLYAYCLNNPLSYYDPDGQFAMFIPLVWVGGAALTKAILTSVAIAGTYWAVDKAIEKGNQWSDKREEARYRAYKEARTEPKDLGEQLTLDEAKAKPQDPDEEIMENKIKDPRYPKDKWKKVEHTHTNADGSKVEIHYWEDRVTGEKHGFKFKNI